MRAIHLPERAAPIDLDPTERRLHAVEVALQALRARSGPAVDLAPLQDKINLLEGRIERVHWIDRARDLAGKPASAR